jgi:hypothetical protein
MNYVDFVIKVENTVGWVLPLNKPVYRARAAAAGAVKKKVATKPTLYTDRNLLLALEYCRRERIQVTSPAAVLWHVEEALKQANTVEVVAPVRSDLTQQIAEAVKWEHYRDDEDSSGWLMRLQRAQGGGREAVLEDWSEARRGKVS